MEVFFAHPKIEKYLRTLEPAVLAEVSRTIFLLEEHGHGLRAPDSKSLGNGLFELRIIDIVHVRIIYMFQKDSAILLHAFTKKAGPIPKADMAYARRLKKEWDKIA